MASSSQLPTPLRAAVGLAAAAAGEARRLPDRVIEWPVLAVSTALQLTLRVQQRYAELAARGEELLTHREPTDEPPAWATFDADVADPSPSTPDRPAPVSPAPAAKAAVPAATAATPRKAAAKRAAAKEATPNKAAGTEATPKKASPKKAATKATAKKAADQAAKKAVTKAATAVPPPPPVPAADLGGFAPIDAVRPAGADRIRRSAFDAVDDD